VGAAAAPSPWEAGGGEAVTARLLVDADQAAWAAGHVGADAVEERRRDGSVVLAVRVTNRDAFRSFVLGFLDHAEILEPGDLRAEMVAWLESICRA
jgi:predicted DNA-binding transcriptional regulator YafY